AAHVFTQPLRALASALQVGDPLPAVTLTDWHGNSSTLTSDRARVTIVDFWASWCAACRTLLPQLDALSREYNGRGLLIAAINVDRTQDPADRFLSEHLPNPALRLLRDPEAATLARFGAAGMPALYVIDQTGTVRMIKAGYTRDELVRVSELMRQLL